MNVISGLSYFRSIKVLKYPILESTKNYVIYECNIENNNLIKLE